MSLKWDIRNMEEADLSATRSKDPSSQVGAAIVKDGIHVVTKGYNGYPAGVRDEGLDDRDFKYPRIVHAEMNAMLTALRHGLSVAGCTMYVTRYPCARCSAAAIQAGISRIVYRKHEDFEERWAADIAITKDMAEQVGLPIECLEDMVAYNLRKGEPPF